jgi:hypothetical protein
MAAAARSQAIARIRAICFGLPEVVEKPFGGHTSPAFRVRDKMFAVISEDKTSMTVKAPKGVQAILIDSDPERFFVPKYVGGKGWVGIRLGPGPPPDWEEVAEIIFASYAMTAPKRLVAEWENSREGDVGPPGAVRAGRQREGSQARMQRPTACVTRFFRGALRLCSAARYCCGRGHHHYRFGNPSGSRESPAMIPSKGSNLAREGVDFQWQLVP